MTSVRRLMTLSQSQRTFLWLLLVTLLTCLLYAIHANTAPTSILPKSVKKCVNILPMKFRNISQNYNKKDHSKYHRSENTVTAYHNRDESPVKGKEYYYTFTATPFKRPLLAKPIEKSSLAPGDSHLPFIPKNVEKMKVTLDLKKYKTEASVLNFPKDPPLKKILFWNDAYGKKHFGFGFGREPFLTAGCRVNTCFTTGDRNRFPLEEIDALLWHFRSNDRSLPKKRSPHTRYIFWMMESASYLSGSIEPFDNLFNWTMTYRLDSDFPRTYGRVYRRRVPLEIPKNINYAKGKTKMAAWFVSHCKTVGGREKFVQKLRKWIKVDIYGKCGAFQCEKSDLSDCHKMINDSYKFYFSFENSLCQDYITEKFHNMMKLNIVPVVYGLGNYSKQVPPHSYIDALNFPSPKALADYLIYLDKNDTAYNEYFRWKPYHHSPPRRLIDVQNYCDLCERLHTDNTTKIYNLQKWFVKKSRCLTRSSPRISRLLNRK